MKKLLFAFVLLCCLSLSTLCSTVYGKVYRVNQGGYVIGIHGTFLTVWNDRGEIQGQAITNNFGNYVINDIPCCTYYVITVTQSKYFFTVPALVFNTAWDDGQGFHLNFQAYR